MRKTSSFLKDKVWLVWRGGILVRIYDNEEAAKALVNRMVSNGVKDTIIATDWTVLKEGF